MSFHIGARPYEIAETVLMPGDPLRARWVAETFLDAAVPVNQVRGMLGYTGTWRGQRVTVQASGMGMPSMSIYANELIRDYGAQVLIRIGSAGALQPDLCLRDVVLAQAASSDGSPSRSLLQGMALAPVADFGLLQAAFRAGQGRGIFIARFEAVVAETIDEELLIPEIQIDAALPLRDISTKFYQILHQFAPFGPGNTRPVFMSTNVTTTKWTTIVGNNHLKLYLKQDNSQVVKGIAYNMGHLYEHLINGESFDVCFSLEENNHNNTSSIQVNVRDILLHSNKPVDQ